MQKWYFIQKDTNSDSRYAYTHFTMKKFRIKLIKSCYLNYSMKKLLFLTK